MADLKA